MSKPDELLDYDEMEEAIQGPVSIMRDVFLKGDCQDSVKQLAAALGSEKSLHDAYETAKTDLIKKREKAAGKGVKPKVSPKKVEKK